MKLVTTFLLAFQQKSRELWHFVNHRRAGGQQTRAHYIRTEYDVDDSSAVSEAMLVAHAEKSAGNDGGQLGPI